MGGDVGEVVFVPCEEGKDLAEAVARPLVPDVRQSPASQGHATASRRAGLAELVEQRGVDELDGASEDGRRGEVGVELRHELQVLHEQLENGVALGCTVVEPRCELLQCVDGDVEVVDAARE